ncbi:flagellin [Manganibacter manganicus]|uniref:Flagellin n=1 Tax=Manganibacter manganicus TaxID=1873176 RepID=A0A1V8RV21_9HYPH|nr:flagellin [Pseudaminobacter manganicus]OQM77041.1 flagellin [Pseudaminobacter manganicus]
MTSILTNASAMTALQTLNQTNKNLAATQNRIATGQRVSTASDNAAYWSIATTMRSENLALSAVKDTLNLGAAVVDTAYTGLNEAIDLGKQIQSKFVAQAQFASGSAEHTAIANEITALTAQITKIAGSATFQGKNLLATGGDLTLVNGIDSATGAAATTTIAAYDLAGAATSMTDAATTKTALDAMNAAAAKFGTQKSSIESQQRFTKAMMDAIDRGVGALVDADMNEESTRLQALQVQQQLGIQALSIANSSPQSILSLFRG